MKLAIVLVLCCVAFAHSLKIFNQNDASTLACCGSGRTFDTTTQICCINSVYSIPDSSSNLQAACCGTKLLTNDQICCQVDSTTVSTNDRAISSSQQCCGTKGFDSTTQLCCGGNVVSSNSGVLSCCGTRTYNPSTDLCCPDTSASSPGVVSNGATNGQTCCGTSGYTSTTQLCCAGKVISNTNNALTCCDATLYTTAFDATSQTCCGGVVNSGGASRSCCGTKAYDAATSICCGGNVISNTNGNLECCGSKSYNPDTQSCCSVDTTTVSSNGKDCAGCKTYTTSITTQFQVNSVAQSIASCCGLTAFDNTKSQCCNGRINSLTSSTGVARSCCGSTTYDATADLCCPDAAAANGLPIIGGLSKTNVQCCGTSTYNTDTQTCLCGKQVSKIVDINELHGEEACCGTTQYNNISATCCSSSFGNFLYPLQPAAGFKCCPQDGQSLYNPGYQICCSTKAVCAAAPSSKLAIRDVEEVSIDFRPLKGNFHPRDTHDFEALLEKHARATRSVEEVEEVEDIEKKKKKKKKKTSSNKADSRDRTSGNIANNSDTKFNLVQCGDSCCAGQGYFNAFQKCCGTPYTGYNVIDVSNTDSTSSPLSCCGDNIYNTQFEGCCTETSSTIDACGFQKANFGIYALDVEICCTN